MILLELFLGFLRVGCFSFGGGYAAVALIRELVLSHGWLSEEMLSYIISSGTYGTVDHSVNNAVRKAGSCSSACLPICPRPRRKACPGTPPF